MPKISIIVAVYNIEEYVEKCLKSVSAQKGNDIEIIIVNDGSSDDSLKICQRFAKNDKRIKIICQENKGLSASRNIGIEEAKGEYLWFIDGDDYINEKSIDILRKYIDQYDIICFNYNVIKQGRTIKMKDLKKYDNIYEKYILSDVVAWNKIFKKSLFKDAKFPENCCYNDIYIIPTLIKYSKKILFIEDYLYNYVDRKNSLSYMRPFQLKDFLYCLNHVYDTLKEDYLEAVNCYYINNLMVYRHVKEIKGCEKHNYKELNKILKAKVPKYYLNKYWNRSLSKKIYIRLAYLNCTFLVKLITYLKNIGN